MSRVRSFLAVLLFGAFIYFGANQVLSLTNPDEVFYAQTAHEMVQRGSWNVMYLFDRPQFEKPIMTYWLLRVAYLMMGENSFSARFFPAAFALAGMLLVYWMVMAADGDRKKAAIAACCLGTAGVYFGMGKTVFTDMIFTVWILAAMAAFWKGFRDAQWRTKGILLFFVCAACAVLTKGPIGIMLPLLTAALFLATQKGRRGFLLHPAAFWGVVLFVAIALPWYLYTWRHFGKEFIDEFWVNDHVRRVLQAEHTENDTWYFYPLTIVGGMFPWAVLTACALFVSFKKLLRPAQNQLAALCGAWIIATLAIFQFAHSKLVSYILPAFPAAALLTAEYVGAGWSVGRAKRRPFVPGIVTGALCGVIPIALVVAGLKFKKYVPEIGPVVALALALAVLVAGIITAAVRGNRGWTVALTACVVPALFFGAMSQHQDFDDYVSSRTAAAMLAAHYDHKAPVLCSKAIVRGVRYFTNYPVAVVNVRGTDFFSPHPVPYFRDDEPMALYLLKNGVTYCVLTRSALADVRRICADSKLTLEELGLAGDEHVLRISAGGRVGH